MTMRHFVFGKFEEQSPDHDIRIMDSITAAAVAEKRTATLNLGHAIRNRFATIFYGSLPFPTLNPELIFTVDCLEEKELQSFKNHYKDYYLYVRFYPPFIEIRNLDSKILCFHAFLISHNEMAEFNYCPWRLKNYFIKAYKPRGIIGYDGSSWLTFDECATRPDKYNVRDIPIPAVTQALAQPLFESFPLYYVINNKEPELLLENTVPVATRLAMFSSGIYFNCIAAQLATMYGKPLHFIFLSKLTGTIPAEFSLIKSEDLQTLKPEVELRQVVNWPPFKSNGNNGDIELPPLPPDDDLKVALAASNVEARLLEDRTVELKWVNNNKVDVNVKIKRQSKREGQDFEELDGFTLVIANGPYSYKDITTETGNEYVYRVQLYVPGNPLSPNADSEPVRTNPKAIQALTVRRDNPGTTLRWQRPDNVYPVKYDIFRTNGNETARQLIKTGHTELYFIDADVQDSLASKYSVEVVEPESGARSKPIESNIEKYTSALTVPTPAPEAELLPVIPEQKAILFPPADIVITSRGNKIMIRWSNNSSAKNIKAAIERKQKSFNAEPQHITNDLGIGAMGEFVDQNVEEGNEYNYKIIHYTDDDRYNKSCFAETGPVKTQPAGIDATSLLCTLNSTNPSRPSVEITWRKPLNNYKIEYQLYRQRIGDDNEELLNIIEENTKTYYDTNIVQGATYRYRVRVNAAGHNDLHSEFAKTAEIRTAPKKRSKIPLLIGIVAGLIVIISGAMYHFFNTTPQYHVLQTPIIPADVPLIVGDSIHLYINTQGGKWESSPGDIVDANGIVVAKEPGAMTVTYTKGDAQAKLELTFRPAEAPEITNKPGVLKVGGTEVLTGTPESGTWKSDNPDIVYIDPKSGNMRAYTAGSAIISYTKNGKSAMDTVKVISDTAHVHIFADKTIMFLDKDTIAITVTPTGMKLSGAESIAEVKPFGANHFYLLPRKIGKADVRYTDEVSKESPSLRIQVIENPKIIFPKEDGVFNVGEVIQLAGTPAGGKWTKYSMALKFTENLGSVASFVPKDDDVNDVGAIQLIYTCGNHKASVKINIQPKLPQSSKISGNQSSDHKEPPAKTDGVPQGNEVDKKDKPVFTVDPQVEDKLKSIINNCNRFEGEIDNFYKRMTKGFLAKQLPISILTFNENYNNLKSISDSIKNNNIEIVKLKPEIEKYPSYNKYSNAIENFTKKYKALENFNTSYSGAMIKIKIFKDSFPASEKLKPKKKQ